MTGVADDRGYLQLFRPSEALRVRTQRRARVILGAMTPLPPRDILEMGSGTGEMSDLLATHTDASVVGVDLCGSFVQTAAARYSRANLTFRVLDLAGVDLASELGQSFDYVVGNGILHHLRADLTRILRQLRGLLRPGGRLLFWEPNLHNPYVYLIFASPRLRRWGGLEPGEMAFTREELLAAFHDAGYTSVGVALRDFLVPGTPAPLIGPLVALGGLAERVPLVNRLAQSLFVSAGA